MKRWSLLVLSMLCADVAFAEPPAALRDAAVALVNQQVVQPLKKAEAKRSKFSRAAPAPKARRVRVLNTVPGVDSRGKLFVRFAIDVQHRFSEDGAWTEDAFVGCVYVEDKQVFIEQGSEFITARALLTGDGQSFFDVCRTLPEDPAKLAPTTAS